MHTPTPWKLEENEMWRITGADGKPVFSHARAPRDNLKVCQSEANRDRIVACVNALAGIADPAAFRLAADAFADSIDGMGAGDEISEEQFDKMCAFAAMLPETAS